MGIITVNTTLRQNTFQIKRKILERVKVEENIKNDRFVNDLAVT